MARNFARTFGQDLMRGEHTVGGGMSSAAPGLTWVGGTRAPEDLDETSRKNLAASSSGTSIFDPVVCELAYSWFCPPGGKVLDPFAGGSVRGIVAATLGRHYTGVELRAEQCAANEAQAAEICGDTKPQWICGDSRAVIPELSGGFDFLFSCPPYGNLEVYSDDPRDISQMPDAAFDAAYSEIILASVAALKPDTFALFVVGNYRGKDGFYRDLCGLTVRAFELAGARYYNEAVLVTAVGSLPIRVSRQFSSARKLGKTHQNILGFCKGNPKRAAEKCGTIEIDGAA
jgi:hypothetical protein